MGAISEFVEAFVSNQDEYSRIKREVDELCKQKLSEQGINFLWDSRVKKAESLRKKLLERQPDYDTEVENVKDIKDLVAGRVIIMRWKDFELVEKVITENFNLKQTCQHPKAQQNLVTLQQRFRGCDGQHFYVTRRLAEDDPSRNLIVEIQVMSGFMWAFSAVEHDIIYKKLHGEPHDDLCSLLEIYKGTANVAEVIMEMLDNFQFDFRHDDAGLILKEDIRKLTLEKKHIIAEKSRNLKRNEEIVSWTSKADVENDHNQQRATLGSQYKDSGQWFRPYYDEFLASTDRSVFWLAGSVGTGKSSLVSNIIEWHFKNIQSRKEERLVFFYCSRKQAGRTTSLEVLRSFIAQLIKSIEGSLTSSVIESIYESRKARPIEIQECSDLLMRILKEHGKTTFVVDALDECENADELLLHLKNSHRKSVKFLFSSRNHVKVDNAFPNCGKLELDSHKDLTVEDMKTYVTSQVKEREILRLGRRLLDGRYPELEDTLIKVLIDQARGMFIWVKLRLELFFGRQSRIRLPADVRRKLDMLKKGDGSVKAIMLDKAYEEIYDYNTEPGSVSRDFAAKALKWMLCAQRPLSITELAEAVSVDENETQDEISEETLLLICSNFIVADESRIAQFAHLSVPEYLERRENDSIKEYSFEEAHTQAVRTCLTCLRCYQAGSRNWRADIRSCWNYGLREESLVDETVYSYSIVYWADHMAAISSHNRARFLQLLFDKIVIYWLELISIPRHEIPYIQDSRLRSAVSRPRDFFFAACVWGLIDMVPESTLKGHWEKMNSEGELGFVLAARHGHYDIVVLFFSKAGNINGLNGFFGKALVEASTNGHENIVRLLLDKRADVNARSSGFYGNALEAASAGGHEHIAQLLIDAGAAVNAQSSGHYGNALQTASACDHENIVRLLLDKGADVNARGGLYGSSLQVASARGHENIVRLLLDRGADVNARNDRNDTALSEASVRGYENIVRLLLDKGANFNARNDRDDTALSVASRRSDENIVRLLLDEGADINSKVLQAACKYGRENIVRIFLERKNAIVQETYLEALQLAADKNHEEIVLLLREAMEAVYQRKAVSDDMLEGEELDC